MKISRTWLLRILIALAFVIAAYSVLRHITGFTLGGKTENFLMDAIMITALGVFIYNRKLGAGGPAKKEPEQKAGGGEKTEPPQ
ncbi:MAG: hypothetical protein LBU18_01250 [Treponema sp.]|jgi:hypothetical protein|nr:hypothetical protein [Treponema sp.]